jgi:hypothetical protein
VVGYAISRSVDARLTLTAVKAAIQVASPRSGVCGVCALLRQQMHQGSVPGRFDPRNNGPPS